MFALLIFYLVLPLIYGISVLPFRVMYVLSDFMYLIIYRLIGYRVEVVQQNLVNSFPDKSPEEILAIRARFYRYFCDLILESVKTLTISPRAVVKRFEYENSELVAKYYEEGQSVNLVLGHYGNWELAGAGFSQMPYHTLYVIYHPLANKYFEKLIVHMRTRLGNRLYKRKEAAKAMVRDRHKVTMTAFIADQSPRPENAYWTTFLNQETGVFTGTAKLSRLLKHPVVYASISRPARGYYKIKFDLIADKPQDMEEDVITELHTRRLEKDINACPYLWLWTHKRWKHKRPQ